MCTTASMCVGIAALSGSLQFPPCSAELDRVMQTASIAHCKIEGMVHHRDNPQAPCPGVAPHCTLSMYDLLSVAGIDLHEFGIESKEYIVSSSSTAAPDTPVTLSPSPPECPMMYTPSHCIIPPCIIPEVLITADDLRPLSVAVMTSGDHSICLLRGRNGYDTFDPLEGRYTYGMGREEFLRQVVDSRHNPFYRDDQCDLTVMALGRPPDPGRAQRGRSRSAAATAGRGPRP